MFQQKYKPVGLLSTMHNDDSITGSDKLKIKTFYIKPKVGVLIVLIRAINHR